MIPNVLMIINCAVFASAQWVQEMENMNLFEGDMVLSPDQKKMVQGRKNAFGAVKTPSKIWNTATIYYGMSPEIASNAVAVNGIVKAMDIFAEFSCLKFRNRSIPGHPEYLYKTYLWFYEGRGCNSVVGFQGTGKRHTISIGKGCWYHVTIMHEMMHAFGFYHEQSRPDRDNYVTINWKGIQPAAYKHFERMNNSVIDSLQSPYDYRSIMHYSWNAWSRPGSYARKTFTIITKDPLDKYEIGQRVGMSYQDQYQLNKLFWCVRPVSTVAPEYYTRPPNNCNDRYFDCDIRAYHLKQCKTHPFMKDWCRRACGLCPGQNKVKHKKLIQT